MTDLGPLFIWFQVCPGGTVPEKYYLKELTSTDHLKSTNIPKGDKLEIVYKIAKKMSVLR